MGQQNTLEKKCHSDNTVMPKGNHDIHIYSLFILKYYAAWSKYGTIGENGALKGQSCKIVNICFWDQTEFFRPCDFNTGCILIYFLPVVGIGIHHEILITTMQNN